MAVKGARPLTHVQVKVRRDGWPLRSQDITVRSQWVSAANPRAGELAMSRTRDHTPSVERRMKGANQGTPAGAPSVAAWGASPSGPLPGSPNAPSPGGPWAVGSERASSRTHRPKAAALVWAPIQP